MTIKKFVRTGMVSTIAMLTYNNAAFAVSCENGLDGYCLTDGNANFSIVHDTATDQYGMDMTVDGKTQVWVLDFMVDNPDVKRAPHAGTDSYVGALDGTLTGTNQVSMANKDIGGYGTVGLDFTLKYDGMDAATLLQTFTFTNTSGATITDLSFLALTDVSLGGFGQGFFDQGELTTFDGTMPTGYRQWSNNTAGLDYELHASVDVAVDSYEVSAADFNTPCTNGDLCDRAYNDIALALTDSVHVGQDDLIMAARWLRTVANGETFSYTQTFKVFDPLNPPPPIPVPAAVWLFGSGLLGLVGLARRKQSL